MLCMHTVYLRLSHCPHKTWGTRGLNVSTKLTLPWPSSLTVTFISDLGVPRLLLASVKLGKPSLLAWKQGKISYPFLAYALCSHYMLFLLPDFRMEVSKAFPRIPLTQGMWTTSRLNSVGWILFTKYTYIKSSHLHFDYLTVLFVIYISIKLEKQKRTGRHLLGHLEWRATPRRQWRCKWKTRHLTLLGPDETSWKSLNKQGQWGNPPSLLQNIWWLSLIHRLLKCCHTLMRI